MGVPSASVPPGRGRPGCGEPRLTEAGLVAGLGLAEQRGMALERWPNRSADSRMAGLLPSIALAGVLHVGVFLLAQGGQPPPTLPEVAPPTLILVSLPTPEPQAEPPEPADHGPSQVLTVAPPEPAAAQKAEALPGPAPPTLPTPPEMAAHDAALPAARDEALPKPSLAVTATPPELAPPELAPPELAPPEPAPPELAAAPDPTPPPAIAELPREPAPATPSLPPEPEAKTVTAPPPLPPKALPKQAAKAPAPKAVPVKPMRQASRSAQASPHTEASHAADAPAGEAQPVGDVPKPMPAPAPRAAPAAVEASFTGRLLQAVQAEARRSYPPSARLMGTTGQAAVMFEYRDGAVHVTGLAQTSGSPVLDRAALSAVQNASYPPPPSELAGQTLVRLVHVKYELTPG